MIHVLDKRGGPSQGQKWKIGAVVDESPRSIGRQLMTRGRLSLLLAGAVTVLSVSHQANAVVFPTVARSYAAWMARAVDQCTPGALTVVTGQLPSSGCLAANTSTDAVMTMDSARVVVKASTGKISVFGSGLIPGSRVKVALALRITKNGVTTKHPPGTNRVTFVDQTVLCAQTPFGFVVSARGVLAGKTDLSTCLSPLTGLASGSVNIEIFSAALVNHDNMDKVFARAGVLR